MAQPLQDITNVIFALANRNQQQQHHQQLKSLALASLVPPHHAVIQQMIAARQQQLVVPTPSQPPRQYQHDPYNWQCLSPEDSIQFSTPSPVRVLETQSKNGAAADGVTPNKALFAASSVAPTQQQPATAGNAPDAAVPTTTEKRCQVHFRCHHAEFTTTMAVKKGQYIIVQGDRGIDVGIVTRTFDTVVDATTTAAAGSVLRFATQREVDYWNTDLKADEKAALEYCSQRAASLQLPMEIRHAEFQFDKKKLTFYFETPHPRVEFVGLLKELFREYSCRIWMEKQRRAKEANKK